VRHIAGHHGGVTAVHVLSPEEVDRAVETLVMAFADDPVMRWLLPTGWRTRGRHFFRMEVAHSYLRHGACYADEALGSVSLWAPPGRWKTGGRDVLRQLPLALLALRGRVPAALGFASAMEKAHPDEPHWYLGLLGTRPDRQGRGLGAAVLAPVLERCDTEGVPAYLESSNPRNVPFYARLGFEPTGEVRFRDAPPLIPMWREPRTT
jgi:GNAT superfamily N-acetyltransferase